MRTSFVLSNAPHRGASFFSLLVAFSGLTTSVAYAQSFAPHVDIKVGSTPSCIVVSDFNGDGKSDMVVLNSNSTVNGATLDVGSVSVLIGSGKGTFAAKRDYKVGVFPIDLVVGDFNSDGKKDLAAINSSDGSVSVLIGSGKGTFAAKRDYKVGSQPISMAVGDFNGDGKSDLVVVNNADDSVSVLIGRGQGTFAAKKDYKIGSGFGSFGVAVGDFDRDGKSDLAIANRVNNSVGVLLGSGKGTFAAKKDYKVGKGPLYVIVGDFNGDGKSDLATPNFNGNSVSVLLGNGKGAFAPHVDTKAGSGVQSVVVGDLNGDRKSDLAIANDYLKSDGVTRVSNVIVLLGNGKGTFAAPLSFKVGLGALNAVVGDFNGDGKSDLATPNGDSNSVSVLLGQRKP